MQLTSRIINADLFIKHLKFYIRNLVNLHQNFVENHVTIMRIIFLQLNATYLDLSK